MSGKELSEGDRQILRDSGISDAEIQLGSLAVGRDYCCGGPNETTNVILLFVPKEIIVEQGDIIEVKMGKLPEETQLGAVNIASRVREKIGEKEVPRWGVLNDRSNRPCRWVPERPHLWMRILYCDWMEEEGWIKYESSLWETWMKPL